MNIALEMTKPIDDIHYSVERREVHPGAYSGNWYIWRCSEGFTEVHAEQKADSMNRGEHRGLIMLSVDADSERTAKAVRVVRDLLGENCAFRIGKTIRGSAMEEDGEFLINSDSLSIEIFGLTGEELLSTAKAFCDRFSVKGALVKDYAEKVLWRIWREV